MSPIYPSHPSCHHSGSALTTSHRDCCCNKLPGWLPQSFLSNLVYSAVEVISLTHSSTLQLSNFQRFPLPASSRWHLTQLTLLVSLPRLSLACSQEECLTLPWTGCQLGCLFSFGFLCLLLQPAQALFWLYSLLSFPPHFPQLHSLHLFVNFRVEILPPLLLIKMLSHTGTFDKPHSLFSNGSCHSQGLGLTEHMVHQACLCQKPTLAYLNPALVTKLLLLV